MSDDRENHSGEESIGRPSVILRKGREVSLLRRHPWVFSGAIAERRGIVTNGMLVDLHSHDGRFVGSGHWGVKGIAVRVLSFERIADEEELLRERLMDAFVLRSNLGLINSQQTNAYRLIHAEGDLLPGLVIDIYSDVAVIQCHSLGMWRLRQTIADIITSMEALRITRVVLRKVEGQVSEGEASEGDDSREDFEGTRVIPSSEPVTIHENGHRFIVDVENGQKTGFFLDQRINREILGRYSHGKQVLNAFAYTGAFSVYALASGASWVCSVDVSKSAIEMCRQNVALNFTGPGHTAEVADCFSYLGGIGGVYDTIVLDPPAFAKHQKAIQRGLRGYETINAHAIKALRPGGTLLTFSCSQLVSRDLFRDVIARAASHVERSVRIVYQMHQSPCHPINLFHPEGDYLKGFVLQVD